MPLSLVIIPGKVFAENEAVTYTKLNQLGAPTVQVLDDDITFIVADGSIVTAKLADGVLSADTTGRAKMADKFVTVAKLADALDLSSKTLSGNPAVTWTGALDFSGATLTPPNGYQVQQVSSSIATVVSAATHNLSITAAAVDDTVPQNTEGVALSGLDLAITPKDATNILEIEAEIPVGATTGSVNAVLALFQDSTAGALAAVAETTPDGTPNLILRLRHRMVAGTTSATTFKLRFDVCAGTVYTNANLSGTRNFGGVSVARLTIRETTA